MKGGTIIENMSLWKKMSSEAKAALAALAFGIPATLYVNCDTQDTQNIAVDKNIGGYTVRADSVGRLRRISINEGNNYLTAIDSDNDGRFDEINLVDLPKGHPLEQFANLNELERVYAEATRE